MNRKYELFDGWIMNYFNYDLFDGWVMIYLMAEKTHKYIKWWNAMPL